MRAQTIIPFLLLTIFAACNNAEREAAMTALTAAADSTSFAADVNNLQSMEPQNLVAEMNDAYIKLLDLAENPKTSLGLIFSKPKDKEEAQQDFEDLTKSIGAFLEEADRVSKAVVKLKELSKSN